MTNIRDKQYTRDEYDIFIRNRFRILLHNGLWLHVEEHINPRGMFGGSAVPLKASVQILSQKPEGAKEADQDCVEVIQRLFPDICRED